MVPDLWRCGGNPLLDIGGLPLHPLGLAALLTAWGILELLTFRWAAVLVRGLLVALSLQSLGLAGFLLVAALVAISIDQNPTWVIDAAQFVGIIAAVVTVFVHLRRESSRSALPLTRRSPRGAPAAVLVGVAAVGFFSTGPLFGENSALSAFRFPRWLFEVVTTPIASDECLARRSVERPTPLLLPHEPDAAVTPYDDWRFDLTLIASPAANAYKTLAGRGPSAMPAITGALQRVLSRADREEEARAVRFLMLVARWTGGHHPILDAWFVAPHRPPGRALLQAWQVCLQKNRHDRVGYWVDAQCDFTK